MTASEPEWFIIASGKHSGRAHLVGWRDSALRTEDGYTSFAVCPRCHSMVLTENFDHSWAHEQWHAQTDWPIPNDLLDSAQPPGE